MVLWAIKLSDGRLDYRNIQATRKQPIATFMYHKPSCWNYWKDLGYRAVKAELREIGNE